MLSTMRKMIFQDSKIIEIKIRTLANTVLTPSKTAVKTNRFSATSKIKNHSSNTLKLLLTPYHLHQKFPQHHANTLENFVPWYL